MLLLPCRKGFTCPSLSNIACCVILYEKKTVVSVLNVSCVFVVRTDNKPTYVLLLLLLLLLLLFITFMQGIYSCVPETNQVPRICSVAAIL
jgi:hypothetical protein